MLCYAAVVGSIMVSYVRARAEGEGLTLREGLFTRAERVILLGGALVIGHGVVLWALWVLAVLSHFTAVQRVATVWQRLRSAEIERGAQDDERDEATAGGIAEARVTRGG